MNSNQYWNAITIWSAQLPIFNLYNELSEEQKKINNYLWDNKKAIRFIQTLLTNFPIPSVYLCLYRNNKIIVDGLQRILTLQAYINGTLEIANVESDWNFKYFDKLSTVQQNKIKSTSAHILIVNVHENKEAIFDIYKRINPTKLARAYLFI